MPIKFNAAENLEPPLGIAYIGAVLQKEGDNVYLKDYEVEHFDPDHLQGFIKDHQIDLVGISFRTASYSSAKEFSHHVKKAESGITVVLGGQHATAFAEQTLQDIEADIVVRGEGEYTFRDLVRSIKEDRSLSGLPGITFLDSAGKIISNDESEPIKDINALPMPLREALPLERYNIITLITSRGCPFNCIYCDKGVSTRAVKYRSPESVLYEIKYITQKLRRNRLYIVDDYFFLHRNRLTKILDGISRSGLSVKWVCQARVDGIDKAIIEKAKKAGCEQIMFGIESGDESELQYIRKKTTNEQAESAVRLSRQYGITARANFMLGFPVSTKETVSNTIRFAKKIHPDIVRFFAVSPLPNTDLWYEVYGPDSDKTTIGWDKLDFFKPNFDTIGLKRKDISLYVMAAYWHVLKDDFLKEISLYLFPNLAKLFYLCVKTGKIRGNISRSFPRSVNLILDNAHQLADMTLKNKFIFLRDAWNLQKQI